jgi:hypothetical protein
MNLTSIHRVVPQITGAKEPHFRAFGFVQIIAGWARCQDPGIALVDLATVIALPDRCKVSLDGGEDRGVELSAPHIVDLWPPVLSIAFGPEDLERLVVLAPVGSGDRTSQVEHLRLAPPALLLPLELLLPLLASRNRTAVSASRTRNLACAFQLRCYG